jgi:hypothetical protein
MQFGIRQYELAQYPVGMKKHHKITAPEQDQIAWWLACGITIREMARRLGRSPCKDTQLPDTLRSFYSYTKGARIGSEFRTLYVSKRTLFDTHTSFHIFPRQEGYRLVSKLISKSKY